MKILKSLSVATLFALFLIGCGGGGGGGSTSNTGGTNTGGTKAPSSTQDNQNPLAYVNGIYEVRGTAKTTNPDGTIRDTLFQDKFIVTYDGNSLKGIGIDIVFSAMKFGKITSDTGTQAKLYQDGSFTANRTITSIDTKNGISLNMKFEYSEKGKFYKDSIQGKMESVVTAENLGKVAVARVTQNYHSINKIATNKTIVNTANINQPNSPTTKPTSTHNNTEKELLAECNRIKNGKFVPFIMDETHSYTCTFGNDRPASYGNFKKVCEKHGFKFQDASLSFMCTNKKDVSRSISSENSISSALENLLENAVF